MKRIIVIVIAPQITRTWKAWKKNWIVSYKDLRIAHINVYSLRSKVDEIRCLQRQCKFEILAITETHLDSSISDAVLNIEGMKFLRFDRKPGKGGGCILFYSIPNIYALCIGKTCLLTALRLSGCRSSSGCFVFGYSMYRPPNDRKFFDFIMSPLERAWLKTSNIIWLGDFNCDLKQGYMLLSEINIYYQMWSYCC